MGRIVSRWYALAMSYLLQKVIFLTTNLYLPLSTLPKIIIFGEGL